MAPSSREGKSGKITPARPSHHTQTRLSPSQATGSSQFTTTYREEQHLSGSAMPSCYLLSGEAKLQRLLGRDNHFTPGKCKAAYVCQTGMMLYPHPQALGNTSERAVAKEHQVASVYTSCLCQSICYSSDRSALDMIWTSLMSSEARSLNTHRL